MGRIVQRVMQSPTLLAGHSVTDDKVSDINHIPQLTYFREEDGLLVQILGLTIEDIQPVERALQTEVGAHNADITAHDGLQFLTRLRNEHHFLVKHSAITVPIGHLVAKLDARESLHRFDAGTV